MIKRLQHLEKTTKSNYVSLVLSRLDLFDDGPLLKLFEVVRLEAVRRNLFLSPEIEAARGLYDWLVADGCSEEDAVKDVLIAVKACGFDIRESDIWPDK